MVRKLLLMKREGRKRVDPFSRLTYIQWSRHRHTTSFFSLLLLLSPSMNIYTRFPFLFSFSGLFHYEKSLFLLWQVSSIILLSPQLLSQGFLTRSDDVQIRLFSLFFFLKKKEGTPNEKKHKALLLYEFDFFLHYTAKAYICHTMCASKGTKVNFGLKLKIDL